MPGWTRAKMAVGAVVWAVLAFLGRGLLMDPAEGRDRHALGGLSSYLFTRRIPVVLRFPEEVEIAVGDPVFYRGAEGTLVPIGEVDALCVLGEIVPRNRALPGDRVREVILTLRAGPGGPTRDARARLLNVPQTASWVLSTLLPPEKMSLIALEWNSTLLRHREEIFEVLNPVVREVLRDVEEVLVADLPAALERRRTELGAVGGRLYDEIVKGEFEPLVDSEIWPLIRKRAQPAIDAIGKEVWARLPVWSLAWRLLYQSLPLTSRGPLQAEVNRFWREETLPILRAHAGDFLQVVDDVIGEAAQNPRVAGAFRRSFERFISDPELQHQLRLLFQELVLDNPRFHEKMALRWASPEVSRALQVLAPRLEPMIRRVGDVVLGTRGGGITPEFARVLRTQILEKDRRWVLLECDPPAPGSVAASREPLEPGAVLTAEVERP